MRLNHTPPHGMTFKKHVCFDPLANAGLRFYAYLRDSRYFCMSLARLGELGEAVFWNGSVRAWKSIFNAFLDGNLRLGFVFYAFLHGNLRAGFVFHAFLHGNLSGMLWDRSGRLWESLG